MADYRLRGGRQPDVAAVANVLAHRGVIGPDGVPLSEALLFAVSGGIGAGYILLEFAHDGGKHLGLGFRSRWQYPRDWLTGTLTRLGVPFDVHTTGGAKGAAARLAADLAAGDPVIVQPDRQLLGYWRLPPAMEAMGGHFVVAYAAADGSVLVDDRNLRPLAVSTVDFDAARARVVSYRNLLVRLESTPGTVDDLAGAVRAGLVDCGQRLGSGSTSFSLPAWRKWARLLTDPKAAKGWPTVFADRTGLAGSLAAIWEAAGPRGMTGGHLRDLFADALGEASGLLGEPDLVAQARVWRDIGGQWDDLAEAAFDERVPEFARIRELTASIRRDVADGVVGDSGVADELWALHRRCDAECPLTASAAGALFADLATRVRSVYAAETAAVAELRTTLAPGM